MPSKVYMSRVQRGVRAPVQAQTCCGVCSKEGISGSWLRVHAALGRACTVCLGDLVGRGRFLPPPPKWSMLCACFCIEARCAFLAVKSRQPKWSVVHHPRAGGAQQRLAGWRLYVRCVL